MKRYDGTDLVLQVLIVAALLAGAGWLYIGISLMSEYGGGQIGFTVALAGTLTALSLVAISQVGRAILDIAHNTGGALSTLSNLTMAPTAATPAPPLSGPAPAKSASFDQRRWGFLKDASPEVAAAADRLAKFGVSWENQLAERLLILNDLALLPGIERHLVGMAEVEKEQRDASTAQLEASAATSATREIAIYEEIVAANGGTDPRENRRPVEIAGYAGSWRGFHGGIKVRFHDGAYLLRKAGLQRLFLEDPDMKAPAQPRHQQYGSENGL